MTEHDLVDGRRWVVGILAAEADRYEPNQHRVWERIKTGTGPDALLAPPPPPPPALERRRPSRQVFRRRQLTAVAVLVALLLGGVWGGRQLQTRSNHEAPAAAGARSVAPSSAAPAQPLLTSPSPATSPADDASPTERSAAPSAATPTPASAPTGPVDLAIRSVASGHDVRLPGSDDVDWVVAGTKPEGSNVRAAARAQLISGPHLTGSPTRVNMAGPFTLAWTGSIGPSVTGARVTPWLAVTGPAGGPVTGMFVRVLDRRSGVLTLYLGAAGADGRLQVRSGDNRLLASVTVPAAGSRVRGSVVTIRFHLAADAGQLSATLTSGSGGSVGIAAAELQ